MTAASPDPASPPERDSGGRMLLALALVLGALRFVRLGAWSLWIDEALTLADAEHHLGGGLVNALGYRLVSLGVALAGGRPDELGLRLLPAIVGWLTIPTAFLVLRRLVGGRAAGLVALVLAVSSWHLFWSQTARFYTFAQFLSLVGVATVLGAYLRGGLVRALVGFGLAASAALLHPSAALALPTLVLLPLAARPLGIALAPGTHRTTLVVGGLALVGLAVASPMLLASWREYAWDKSLASPASLVLTTGFYVTPLVAGLALVGAWSALCGRDPAARLVLALVVGVLATALAASLAARVVAQYVFFLLPWIALLACLPLASASATREGRILRGGVALVLVLAGLTSCALYLTKRMGERPRWREAYAFVAEHARAGDGIFGMAAPVGEYYLAPETPDLRAPERVAWFDRFRPRLAEQWARYDRRVWFVIHPKWFEDWDGADADRVREFLRRECRQAAAFPLNADLRDLSLEVWVRE